MGAIHNLGWWLNDWFQFGGPPREAIPRQGTTVNQRLCRMVCGYVKGRPRARLNLISHYEQEQREGVQLHEGPWSMSHDHWHAIAAGAARLHALRVGDAEILELTGWWWRTKRHLARLCWAPRWERAGGVLCPGPRAWSAKRGARGPGLPGSNPYLDDIMGALLFGQAHRLRQVATMPDALCLELVAALRAEGDDFGGEPEPGRLVAEVHVRRWGEDMLAWTDPPPHHSTAPVLYWVRALRGGEAVEWGWEPLPAAERVDSISGGV